MGSNLKGKNLLLEKGDKNSRVGSTENILITLILFIRGVFAVADLLPFRL